jgi:alkylation response protein AidB-like acyl-CoA dehydrogenase
VRELAKTDGSLAHLLGYHYHFAELIRFFGTEEQRGRNLAEAVRAGWFWGGAVNPRDPAVELRTERGRMTVRGRKTFCTGARVADRLIVGAAHVDTGQAVFLSLPSQRPGIVINDDWDVIGQRQAESGSVEFHDAEVHAGELIGAETPAPDIPSAFSSLAIPVLQHLFVNLYIGMAYGAVEEARQYTRTTTRPWQSSGVEAARFDPYIIEQYGTFWSELAAATALADQVGVAVQRAYDKGEALTVHERGEVAVAVATAKVVATRVSLAITSAMFEVMGARATAASRAYDRFWRNVRTHTLHDPIVYKVREVGDFVLNDVLPEPTAYS